MDGNITHPRLYPEYKTRSTSTFPDPFSDLKSAAGLSISIRTNDWIYALVFSLASYIAVLLAAAAALAAVHTAESTLPSQRKQNKRLLLIGPSGCFYHQVSTS